MVSFIAIAFVYVYLCAQARPILDIPSKSMFERTTLQDIISKVNSQSLNRSERLAILENTALVLEQYNPHRFIHLNCLNVDPAKMLRDLKAKLDKLSNFEFHRRVSRIFSLMDDFHTQYYPPYPLNDSFASLGFFISQYYLPNETTPTYIIPEKNLTVVAIDSIPTHRLVIQLGTRGFGSNRASKRVFGMRALTFRIIALDRIPWNANATLLLNNGLFDFVVNVSWNFFTLPPPFQFTSNSTNRIKLSLLERFFLFKVPQNQRRNSNSSFYEAQMKNFSSIHVSDPTINQIPAPQFTENFYESSEIITPSITYGYIIIKTFQPDIPPLFTGSEQFYPYLAKQLFDSLQKMPYDAVVVDVSDNIGGAPYLVKQTFEFLTNKNVPPMPVLFRATNLTLSMFSSHFNENDALFSSAVNQSLKIGEQFTGPITYLFNYTNLYDGIFSYPRARQAFAGRLILVTNGASYSASSLLASWVQDTNAGLVIGLDEATGGGGASFELFSDLQLLYPKSFSLKMPHGADFTTSSIRLFRSGKHVGGTLIENVGVHPTKRYFLTYRDVVDKKKDLFGYLGKQAAAMV